MPNVRTNGSNITVTFNVGPYVREDIEIQQSMGEGLDAGCIVLETESLTASQDRRNPHFWSISRKPSDQLVTHTIIEGSDYLRAACVELARAQRAFDKRPDLFRNGPIYPGRDWEALLAEALGEDPPPPAPPLTPFPSVRHAAPALT